MNHEREADHVGGTCLVADLAAAELPDISVAGVEDLWVESLPDQVSAGCCWTSAACFTSLGTFGSCASTSTSASSASCAC
ncbi:thiocillin family RiPP [Arachnia propionica]|uniref:Thiocillin family RiPP n=1 Tax=Arachnia propionica TaxID=1750 RepID=A0A3P1WP81_9ACTN|nr:thiocillin family RiPP [Arachnia propionica]